MKKEEIKTRIRTKVEERKENDEVKRSGSDTRRIRTTEVELYTNKSVLQRSCNI